MNKSLHTIKLKGFDLDKGKISFSLLHDLFNQLEKIAEGTLRLYVEGKSIPKKGQTPDWLKKSMDFTLTGIKKGSTVLQIEAPLLKDTLPAHQYSLFNELGIDNFENDTAISLSLLAYQKALSDEHQTDLLDKYLLKEMSHFNKIIHSDKAQIDIMCSNLNRRVVLERKAFEKVKHLEESTPEPLKIKVSGKLDVIKYSNSQLEILTQNKKVKVTLPEKVKMDNLKTYFGRDVSIIGLANFNPARQICSIEMSDIQFATDSDSFFNTSIPLIQEKTDVKQLMAEQNYKGFNKTKFNNLIDQLQIEESIDDLLNALAH